ncbi:MAG: cytochrome b/b6 domain-containing protein [Proteobacteria bacterium]|nr:cytochrome b/b6 domain-containing protein [Pseudomonadota bacterium]
MPNTSRVVVWDLPTRLFHWTLAILILLQYGTAEWHWLSMRWHVWFGYATLALLLFRVIWGFAGSQTSRFGGFVRGPARVLGYVRDLAAQRARTGVGHNPLGGWSVLAMLACLLVQTVTGLFASNRRHTEFGPWADRVSQDWSRRLTEIHEINQNLLLVLIALHVAAILFYWIGKQDNLIGPMLHGHKEVASPPSLRFASSVRALCVLAFAALVVWLVVLAGSRI